MYMFIFSLKNFIIEGCIYNHVYDMKPRLALAFSISTKNRKN